MMLGGFFWLLLFSGFFLYWALDAFILQLSSQLIIRSKPRYWDAVGITGLVYVIEAVVGVVSVFLSMALVGRMSMGELMHVDISSWFSFVPWVVVFFLISTLLFALIIGWLYGKMLKDAQGQEIRLWKGIVVFLVQFVITRFIISIFALGRLLWMGAM